MRQREERVDGVVLRGPAELDRRVPSAEEADRLRERAGDRLDRERVGVAGAFVGRALLRPRPALRGHAALAEPGRELPEDLVDIRVGAGDRRACERARKVAVLAMRRAALGQVEAPIGRGRDRLEAALRRARDRDRERRLGARVGLARVAVAEGREADEPIARQLHDLGAQGGRALGHCPPMREAPRGPGQDDVPGRPELRSRDGRGKDGPFGDGCGHGREMVRAAAAVSGAVLTRSWTALRPACVA